MMGRIRFGLIYALVMVGLVIAVDYALFWRYVAHLEDRQKPEKGAEAVPNISVATLRRVGAFNNRTLSAFTRFPPGKPAGVFRVGVFGGSHANGAEVDPAGDFPSQLARLLEVEGVRGVEVLNFGSSWYGMTQSYILWDEVGRRFGLDAILLAPQSFQSSRDTQFNHSEGESPYFLHSRFILERGRLKRIDVIGDSPEERFRRYHSFLTPWRYLRYDRNDPPFLAAALPEGRVLGNPFYYDRRSEENESKEIQRRLLRTMIDSGTPVVLGEYPQSGSTWSKMEELADEDFCAATIERPLTFPYIAPRGHSGPTANAFIAYQYLALLLGRPVAAPIVATASLEAAPAPATLPAEELEEFEEVRILMNGVEAGRFSTPAGRENPSFLRDRGVKALLAIGDDGSSVLDGVFLAFPDAVDTAAPMRLVLQSSNGEQSVPLVRRPEARDELHFGAVALPGLETARSRLVLSRAAMQRLFGERIPAGTLRLAVGGRVVLEGDTGPDLDWVELHSIAADLYWLRASATGDAAADRGSVGGLVEMILRRGADAVSLPLARWRIEQRPLNPATACPPNWRPPLPAARLSNGLRPSGG